MCGLLFGAVFASLFLLLLSCLLVHNLPVVRCVLFGVYCALFVVCRLSLVVFRSSCVVLCSFFVRLLIDVLVFAGCCVLWCWVGFVLLVVCWCMFVACLLVDICCKILDVCCL